MCDSDEYENLTCRLDILNDTHTKDNRKEKYWLRKWWWRVENVYFLYFPKSLQLIFLGYDLVINVLFFVIDYFVELLLHQVFPLFVHIFYI